MNKVKNVWVVAAGAAIAELTTGAARYGETVTLVYTGDKNSAVNADKAYYLGDGAFFACGSTAAKLVAEAKPEMVLLTSSKDSGLVASHIAAACGTSVQTDASDITIEGTSVLTNKMVYGGTAVKTERSSGGTAVVCVAAGTFMAGETKAVAEIIDTAMETDGRIKLVEMREKTASTVNLNAAKKVVGVGRGLADENALDECRKFAALIGGEVGCTRPISEERGWMGRELYIGVSGAMIKPECYISVGISGQVQHVVGVNKSGTIIAINQDENAPIFKSCDYGIVGDLHKIIPALNKLLES